MMKTETILGYYVGIYISLKVLLLVTNTYLEFKTKNKRDNHNKHFDNIPILVLFFNVLVFKLLC